MAIKSEQITLRDVYDIVNRLEEKFDSKVDDLDKRIRGQESFQNRVMGITGVLSVFSSMVATFVWQKIAPK